MWQSSVIHGVCGAVNNYNVTVYPHAIGLSASFDVDLMARVSQATWLEARIINELAYNESGGTVWANTIAAGGPLANTVHDPRYGRAAETYGEDPYLASLMGATAVKSLQNRSVEGFVAVGVVTRHWLGYHEAQPDLLNGGNEFIDFFSFSEQQELPYRACLTSDGGSEGIMCAMSSFSIGPREAWNTSSAPLIPSCLHPFLWEKLRGQWNSSAWVQTDCCDSITEMSDVHHYPPTPDLASSLSASLTAGVEGSFGLTHPEISPVLASLLANGSVPSSLLEERLRRTLLGRFHSGEFDMGVNPAYPFRGPWDPSLLDGSAHRTLARESAAASLVLLTNSQGVLPLLDFPVDSQGGGAAVAKVAIIGPFADCKINHRTNDVDSPLACSYLHSYTGTASSISSVLSQARVEGESLGFSVAYAQGSNILTRLERGIAAAVAEASSADVTLLCLGLGTLGEREGFDRVNLTLPGVQQELFTAVSAAVAATAGRKGKQGRLIILLVSAGLLDLNYAPAPPSAILQAFYPGEETGSAVWDVVLGRVNPSARLPLTAYKQSYLEFIPPMADFTMQPTGSGGSSSSVQSVGRTYRFLNASMNHLVNFWFGSGLSYTEFEYSSVSAAPVSPPPPPGDDDTLPYVILNVTLHNVGATWAGAEVVQVYVSVPPAAGAPPPPKYSLASFRKTPLLKPLESVFLSFSLTRRSFETTHVDGSREVIGGVYTIYVSGHVPEEGAGPANTLVTTITLPPPPRVKPFPIATTTVGSPPPSAHPLEELGVFDVETGPSTIQWWNPLGGLVVFESIFCGYWGHAGAWDARYEGHSYYRVRNFSSGVVLANLSLSLGFAYGSAFVDHAASPPRFWIFGTPHDRCGHAVMPNNTGVWAFWSEDPELKESTWSRSRTDMAWNLDGHGANVDVASVLPPDSPGTLGLPPHGYIMMTDRGTFGIRAADLGKDLTTGWQVLPPPVGTPGCPGGCQCPSIRYLPSDGHYYVISGGHNIWLTRSSDLVHWEIAGGRTPIIVPSPGDGIVAGQSVVGAPFNIQRADAFYASRGKNTSTQMLSHLNNWDFDSNDADFCCESWGGASGFGNFSLINWGPSSQGTPPTGGLTGPTAFQALAVANVSLDILLQSFFPTPSPAPTAL